MPFKTNAVPTIAVKLGEFNSNEVANDIAEITPPGGVTVSSIITKSLNTMTAAATVLVLASGQRILVSDDDTIDDAILTEAGAKIMTIKPVAGQEGRTLAFEQSGAETAGFDAATKTAILELINAARPKYNVASLVQNILAKCPALPEGKRLAISINQDTGDVKVVHYTDDGLDIDCVDVVATSAHGLNVTMPITPIVESSNSGDNTLKFEGGAV